MKYDVLRDYGTYIKGLRCPETARTYSNRLETLLEGQSIINTLEKLDIDKIINNLSNIKYKNHFSQSKNALLHFCNLNNITLNEEQNHKIKELERNTIKKYRKMGEVDFQNIQKKINYIRNKKLKLNYQTLLETGLRVSELAQIKKSDCKITENCIEFHFIAKGGNKDKITIRLEKENQKIFSELRKLIETSEENKKVFYSARYLQKKAKELDFKCHDLRRACAKIEYKKTNSKESVQEKLRHTNIENTNIYLKSKIKI